MINITRKDNVVVFHFELMGIGMFPFSFSCANEWSAKLLESALVNALADRVQAVRKEEYTAGLKDARGKKDRRRDWFDTGFAVGVKK